MKKNASLALARANEKVGIKGGIIVLRICA